RLNDNDFEHLLMCIECQTLLNEFINILEHLPSGNHSTPAWPPRLTCQICVVYIYVFRHEHHLSDCHRHPYFCSVATNLFHFSKDGSSDANRSPHVARHGRLGGDLEFLGIHKHVACDDGGHDAAFDCSDFVDASHRLSEENSKRLRRHLSFCAQLFS